MKFKHLVATLAATLIAVGCGSSSETDVATARVFDESIPLASGEFVQPSMSIADQTDFADLIVVGSVVGYIESVEEFRDGEDISELASVTINDAVVITPTEIFKGADLLTESNITVTIASIVIEEGDQGRVLLPAVATLRPGIETRNREPDDRPEFVLFLQNDDSAGQPRFIMPTATSAILTGEGNTSVIDEIRSLAS